jgi:hypothetical protein
MSDYAGIGSRKLSEPQLEVCREVARRAAAAGWRLHTGACIGADQAFAKGAIEAGGAVTLYLPWRSYEEKWVTQAYNHGALVLVLSEDDHEAWTSVALHPKAHLLSNGARALHARNFCIIRESSWVAAYPLLNQYGNRGGTGHGMLLAKKKGIPILDLSTL